MGWEMFTVHKFPSFEPLRFGHLQSLFHHRLRKDILHRAVVWEADNARQGSANTKTRAEVRGSGRKLRPQKGTGQARLGDRGSPMLRGGGVAHGPTREKIFATKLPRKIYALAMRTAWSTRYARGQVIVADQLSLQVHKTRALLATIEAQDIGHDRGGCLFICHTPQPDLQRAASNLGRECLVKQKEDVTVHNLLKWGNIVVEQDALPYFASL